MTAGHATAGGEPHFVGRDGELAAAVRAAADLPGLLVIVAAAVGGIDAVRDGARRRARSRRRRAGQASRRRTAGRPARGRADRSRTPRRPGEVGGAASVRGAPRRHRRRLRPGLGDRRGPRRLARPRDRLHAGDPDRTCVHRARPSGRRRERSDPPRRRADVERRWRSPASSRSVGTDRAYWFRSRGQTAPASTTHRFVCPRRSRGRSSPSSTRSTPADSTSRGGHRSWASNSTRRISSVSPVGAKTDSHRSSTRSSRPGVLEEIAAPGPLRLRFTDPLLAEVHPAGDPSERPSPPTCGGARRPPRPRRRRRRARAVRHRQLRPARGGGALPARRGGRPRTRRTRSRTGARRSRDRVVRPSLAGGRVPRGATGARAGTRDHGPVGRGHTDAPGRHPAPAQGGQ